MATATVPSPQQPQPHVLIIGAGITGLVLAQCLKKNSIPSTVFERDPDPDFRGRGWGLTIHWSLPQFLALLPQHLIDRLPEVYVNPEASEAGENGHFLFFDLQSGEAKWKVPPSERIRVSRERLRALLLEGVDVQWSKTLTSFAPTATPQTNSITATFSDGTTASDTLLIGADGSHSRVRSLLLPSPSQAAKNNPLPYRLLGASVIYPTTFAQQLRDLDPFFFQGGDPATDTFLYFSFLDTPSSYARRNRGHREECYECQIIISWPFRSGWRGHDLPCEVPATMVERVGFMKDIASEWAEPFHDLVERIPEDTEVKAITLEDWVPKRGGWDNLGGRVTMVGDAAHAMTMYRGEGANHGIADIHHLTHTLLPVLQHHHRETAGPPGLANAITAYETEMIARTGPAVLTSRRACADAHDYARIGEGSPLVSRRVMVTEEE